MSTNKTDIVELNGYGYVSSNDEAANNYYIFIFTYITYMLQVRVYSDDNQLSSGEFSALQHVLF